MNLDEAIQSFKDEMEKQTALGHSEHIDNLEQMSEWLKELKAYKEKETCETCGHHKAYQHGADITTMDDECGGCCSWNSKWIPNTCGDAISRQAVEKITWEEPSYTDALNVLTEVRDKIRELPSVTPQQRTGRWIQKEEEGDAEPFIIWECSECHCVDEDGKPSYKYCPQCGARMEVEE